MSPSSCPPRVGNTAEGGEEGAGLLPRDLLTAQLAVWLVGLLAMWVLLMNTYCTMYTVHVNVTNMTISTLNRFTCAKMWSIWLKML